jgi:hypothetical protein
MKKPKWFWILAATTVAGVLSACGGDRHKPETYPILVTQYEDVHGTPVPPPPDGNAGTIIPITEGGQFNKSVYLKLMINAAYEPMALNATSRWKVTAMIIHELLHGFGYKGGLIYEDIHDAPQGCYSSEQPSVTGVVPLCEYEKAWALRHEVGQDRPVHVRKDCAWLEEPTKQAIEVVNSSLGKRIFVYAGLK